MDIWDGQAHRLYPGQDFFAMAYEADLEPVGELEGDVRMEQRKLPEPDLTIASVEEGFNAFANRLRRVAEALGLEFRAWYISPRPTHSSEPVGKKHKTEVEPHKLGPWNQRNVEYWVQVTSPVSEEIRNVLA